MILWWLSIVFCLTTGAGDNCSWRVIPEPVQTKMQCELLAAELVALDMGFRPTYACHRFRPDLLLAPGPWSRDHIELHKPMRPVMEDPRGGGPR